VATRFLAEVEQAGPLSRQRCVTDELPRRGAEVLGHLSDCPCGPAQRRITGNRAASRLGGVEMLRC
jgi:hypothetical protein